MAWYKVSHTAQCHMNPKVVLELTCGDWLKLEEFV